MPTIEFTQEEFRWVVRALQGELDSMEERCVAEDHPHVRQYEQLLTRLLLDHDGLLVAGFPRGTTARPVDNLKDAIAIMEAHAECPRCNGLGARPINGVMSPCECLTP